MVDEGTINISVSPENLREGDILQQKILYPYGAVALEEKTVTSDDIRKLKGRKLSPEPIPIKRKIADIKPEDITSKTFAATVKTIHASMAEKMGDIYETEIVNIGPSEILSLAVENGHQRSPSLRAFDNIMAADFIRKFYENLKGIVNLAMKDHLSTFFVADRLFSSTNGEFRYHSASVGITASIFAKLYGLDEEGQKSALVAGALHCLGEAAASKISDAGERQKLQNAAHIITYNMLTELMETEPGKRERKPINGVKPEEAHAAYACYYRYDGKRKRKDTVPWLVGKNPKYVYAGQEYEDGKGNRPIYKECREGPQIISIVVRPIGDLASIVRAADYFTTAKSVQELFDTLATDPEDVQDKVVSTLIANIPTERIPDGAIVRLHCKEDAPRREKKIDGYQALVYRTSSGSQQMIIYADSEGDYLNFNLDPIQAPLDKGKFLRGTNNHKDPYGQFIGTLYDGNAKRLAAEELYTRGIDSGRTERIGANLWLYKALTE